MKLFKKSVAVFLALLMAFGSMSVLATAADAQFKWAVDTKFYRMQRNADGYIVNSEGKIIADENDKFFTKNSEGVIVDKDNNAVTLENVAVGDPVWIPTTTAKKGESVKARIFMETDFKLSATQLIYFYSGDFLEVDTSNYVDGSWKGSYALNTAVSTISGDFKIDQGYDDNLFGDMVYDGFMEEEFMYDKSWILLQAIASPTTKLDGKDYLAEFDFTVKEDATEEGQFYLSVECLSDYENWLAPSTISAEVDGEVYISCDVETGTFECTRNDQDEDSSLTVVNDVVFENPVFDESGNPVYVQAVDENGEPKEDAEGNPVYVQKTQLALNKDGYPYLDSDGYWVYEPMTDAEGNPVYVQKTTKVAGYSASLGDKLSSIADFAVPTVSADGKQFLGWSLDGNTKLTAEEIGALEVDYNTITLTAMYQAATADYIYNLYVMDKEGEYPEKPADKDPVGANTGDKIEYVETLPEKPEADVTYVVFGTKGFTLDTSKNNTLKTTVTTDDEDVITVYLKRNQYDATFGDETVEDVYYEASYAAPAGPVKAGYTFAGWETTDAEGKVVNLKEGETATMGLEDVVYTATYAPAANKATIVINYVDQVTKEAKTVNMEVPSTTENTVAIVEEVPAEPAANTTYVTYAELTDVTHYEFTAEGSTLTATVAADGSTTLNVNYVPVEYTATFTGAVENGTITEPYYTEITAPAAPEVAGQTFEGWTVNGTDVVVEAGKTVKLEGDVTYTPKYSVDNYTITYVYADPAPAGVAVPSQVTDAVMNTPVDLSHAPTADGWTFDGWTVEGAVADGDGYKVGEAPVTVTGKWIKNTYTMKFFLNEAKTVPYGEVLSYSFGDAVEFPADPEDIDLPENGTYFDSWDLTKIDEINNTTVGTHFTEVSKGQYVAEFVAITADYEYTVTFICANPSGGFATKTIDALNYGDVVTAADLPNTTIDGYTFDYWMIGSQKVTDWVDYTVTGNVQVRAYFNINTYEAVFYGNGGYWLDENDEPTIESVTLEFDYEEEITAPTSIPVRTGYHLDADLPWGQELGYMDIEDVEFYAEWIPNEYEITFVVEGTSYESTQTYGEKLALADGVVTDNVKPGYTFKGWTADGGVTVVEDITTLDVPAANTTYTAVFTPASGGVDYTVNRYFMNTSGNYDGVVPEVITLHEVAETEVTYNVEVSGFTLDTSLGNLTGVVAGDGSLVLNAYYSRNKITVDINGDVDEYFQGEEVDLPDAPEKEGETFDKWVDDKGNEVSDPYIVPNEEDKEVTITPVYTKNTYTATFIISAEGVSNTYTTTEAQYESPVVVPAVPTEAYLPTGYTFVGWAKTEGATEALDNLGAMPVNGITFYAVLAGKTTISYNIEKYFMETDGVTYTLDAAKSETKTDGTAGVEKTITPDSYEGFTFDADNANNKLTAMIKGDGTTTFKVYYDRNKVTVTIDGEPEEKFYGEEIQTPENVPEDEIPEGNKQDGWVDGNGDPVEFPITVGTDPIVINPNFVPAEFLMTFKNGDATVQSGNQTFGEKLTVPADQVLAGHTFDGWFDAAGNKVVAGTTTVPSAAATYTAKFSPISYKVSFVADGQTIQTGDYAFGTKISTIAPAYTAPEGYTFAGWSTDGSTVIEFTDNVTVPVDGVTYYAVLNAESGIKYTIKTYLQNVGGSGYTPQADEVKYGTTGEEINYVPADKEGFTLDNAQSKLVIDSLAGDGSSVIRVFYNRNQVNVTIDGEEDTYYYDDVIEKEDPTPDPGYTFEKWVDGEGNTVTFPMNVPAEDIVITPVYTPIKYAVTFNVNGAEYATGMYDYNTDIVAPENDPTVAGYTFEGWSTDGKTVLDDLGKVALNGNTFQAVLTPNAGIKYTVNKVFQNADGSDWGTPVAEERTGTAGETVALDKAAEAVAGFSVYQIDPASTTIAGDGSTVIYIYYTRNKVSVTINGEKDDYYFEETIEEPQDTEKPGYDFKGWVDDEGNTVTFPITVPAEDIVITPVYEAQTKSLSFEIDGVTVEGYPTTAKVDSDITAPADPEKDGYSFVGWYVKGTSTAFNGKMPTADVVYEAKWTAGDNTQYVIEIYMMDTDGQYSLSTATVSYGLTGAMATIVPSTTSGFTYDASLSELNKEIAADGSTVLKIYYARDLYTVTWNVDGLETEDEVYYGAAIIAPADPAKDGYTFAGWDPAVPATMPANDVEFTATWTEATYTITYVVNGTKETENYKYGDTVTVKAEPSVEGMSFNGWFDGNTEYAAGSTFTMPAKDLIIVADFSIAVYKVTYLDANGAVFATEMVKFGDPIPVPAEEPTKEYHVFTGWDITYDKMPAEDIVVAPIFERVPVKLIPMAGSTTVIDTDNMVIYGLQEYLTESILRNNYLDVEGDGFFTITPVDVGCYGTGTKVTLYDNLDPATPVETYTIVVFGDINGDSFVQAIDCTYADEENLMITDWSQEQIFDGSAIVANPNYDLYKTMAADLNGDGIIDSTDATIIGDASIGIIIIDQVTGRTA